MPVISVSKNSLYARLGQSYTDDAFHDLCFEFGVELDEIVADEKNPENTTFKIEIPANRYDLLCLEGLSRALKLFIGKETQLPQYKVVKPAQMQKMIVKKSVSQVRPVVVCSVLRGVTFTEENYNSFIELQDKLHQNICRKRTLVSIGTHDLDTIVGPFRYEALAPTDIVFAPLNNPNSMDAAKLMTHLEKDLHLKQYLYIIRDKPTYPVIYDSKDVVLSLPPIINGDHSKITMKTKNVFIEVTATDRTKANIVLDTISTMFAEYTSTKFEVEQVEVHDENTGETVITPAFAPRKVTASLSYLKSAIGAEISKDHVVSYLKRMSVPSEISSDGNEVVVTVPPTRSDLLHACDVMEDVAIGYGFNKLIASATSPTSNTPGSQQPINKLADALRNEIAQAGYTEVLTLSLCSTDENYKYLNKKDDGLAVRIANPKTMEYQVARTSLFPGLMKTLSSNQKNALPIKIFEASDVVLKSEAYDVGAKNKRCLAAMFSDTSAKFEVIHGLLDRVMMLLEIPASTTNGLTGYKIVPHDDPTFFPGRCANVVVSGKVIGVIGIIHPSVLEAFEYPYPVSAFHLDLEELL